MSIIFTKSFSNQVAIAAGAKWSPSESELSERDLTKYGPFNDVEATNNSVLDDISLQTQGTAGQGEELLLGGTTKVIKPVDGLLVGRPIISNADSSTDVAIGEIKLTVRRNV